MRLFSLCVFQDEVDSQSPILRDNPQLHEEVKGWLKDQKVQEIFMQGEVFCSTQYSVWTKSGKPSAKWMWNLFVRSGIWAYISV